MKVDFKFDPKQRVKIVAYGLGCEGRIYRCYVSGNSGIFYDVEYVIDGEIKQRDFYEDDLEAIGG